MGVPLEEMDAVFGEGLLVSDVHHGRYSSSAPTEELEERLEDEESERASLYSRQSRRLRSSGLPSKTPWSGIVDRVLGRTNRAAYEPIRGDE